MYDREDSKDMMSKLQVEVINALAELELVQWKYEPASHDEVRIKCPVHEDRSPSVMLNTKKNLWQCHTAGCMAKGDIITLLSHIYKVERRTMIATLSERYDLGEMKEISLDVVEKFHSKIWLAGPLLQALRDRGVTDPDIREARLGFHDGRITIPIFIRGKCVNIRRYLPGAPGKDKMKNTTGYSEPQIYQEDQLKFDTVWVLGGEIKALVVKKFLNPAGIGAVSTTEGEGNWNTKHNPKFRGKRVYFCYDVDNDGRVGARRAAMHLQFEAASLHLVHLPLNRTKYPKGDVNDYIGQEGAGQEDILRCHNEAEKWIPPAQDLGEDDSKEPPDPVNLVEATEASKMGRSIQLEAIISAMDTTPFIVPKDVSVSCTRDQPNCPWCPVKAMSADDNGLVQLTVKGTSSGILEMLNSPKKSQREATREALRIPVCKTVEFTVKAHMNVTDVRLAPQLNIGSETSEQVVQPAYVIGSDLDLNTPYRLTGRVFPSPKNQQAILLMSEHEQVEDSLNSFEPTDAELAELEIFQAKDSDIASKVQEIHADFEANVTRICGRSDLHMAVDLFYHSPLLLNLDGRVTKGWTNILILGDSSQGKSEVSSRLRDHYSLGERVECKNASVAGLLGGLQQIGNRWFVSWGVIPNHDRRAVILEETKGISTEVIGKLTDARSTGLAEIPKIEKRKAHARTRLLFISNPRSDRPMAAYNFGIETIKELIGGLEDVRRFDLAFLVSTNQVSAERISKFAKDRGTVPHKFTGDKCRRLVLWAWTRRPDNIQFEAGAYELVLERTTRLCSMFTEALPLVDRGTMRHKLARLSAALAARLFSTGATHRELVVRKSHVKFMADFIERLYGDPVFGYLDFTDAQVHTQSIKDEELVVRRILSTKYPADFVDSMLFSDDITSNDISDWTELDRDEAEREIGFFVRKHALFRDRRNYKKTSDFIRLLKQLKTNGKLPKSAVPEKGGKF